MWPVQLCIVIVISLGTVVLSIRIGMVPSIIDVWGYDRKFCSPSPPPPSRVTQTPTNIVQKFCKNVDIHNAKRLHIKKSGIGGWYKKERRQGRDGKYV